MIAVLVTMKSGEKLQTQWDVTLEQAEQSIQQASHIRFPLDKGSAIAATSEMGLVVFQEAEEPKEEPCGE